MQQFHGMNHFGVPLFPLDRLEQERTYNDLPSAVRSLDPLTQAIQDSSSEAVALAMVQLSREEVGNE